MKLILVFYVTLCCAKFGYSQSINVLNVIPSVGNLAGDLKTNAEEAGSPLDALENILTSNNPADLIAGLKNTTQHEVEAFEQAANNMQNFVNNLEEQQPESGSSEVNGPAVFVPRPLLIKAAQAIAQIATVFKTEVGQLDTLLDDLEIAVQEVVINNNYISMPLSLQQKFITIVNGLANSTSETSSIISALENDVQQIQTEINSSMIDGNSQTINGLLNILLGILSAISGAFETMYTDVEAIDNSFTDLGNTITSNPSGVEENVLIPEQAFTSALDSSLESIVLSYLNIQHNAALLQAGISVLQNFLP